MSEVIATEETFSVPNEFGSVMELKEWSAEHGGRVFISTGFCDAILYHPDVVEPLVFEYSHESDSYVSKDFNPDKNDEYAWCNVQSQPPRNVDDNFVLASRLVMPLINEIFSFVRDNIDEEVDSRFGRTTSFGGDDNPCFEIARLSHDEIKRALGDDGLRSYFLEKFIYINTPIRFLKDFIVPNKVCISDATELFKSLEFVDNYTFNVYVMLQPSNWMKRPERVCITYKLRDEESDEYQFAALSSPNVTCSFDGCHNLNQLLYTVGCDIDGHMKVLEAAGNDC